MATMKQFCEKSHISPSLIRAVVRQCGGWKDFQEMARDVTRGGADAGFGGWTYYSDTVQFTKSHKAIILDMAQQMADNLGEPLYKMIGGFNCLKITGEEAAEAIHNPKSEVRTQVYNALAWFALEETARSFDDMEHA